MFTGTIWSLLPPILAIMLALITKEVYSSLFVGIVVGSFMYAQFHPWTAFTVIFDTIKDSMNINILFFLVMLGMIVVLEMGDLQDQKQKGCTFGDDGAWRTYFRG